MLVSYFHGRPLLLHEGNNPLPGWTGINSPGDGRRIGVRNPDHSPMGNSSPIVNSLNRATKRRRMEAETGTGSNVRHGFPALGLRLPFIFQVHDVLETRRTSSHRALPDLRLLRDAARHLQTPKCPLNDDREDSTPRQGRRKGKTVRPAPPYQLSHYSPFTKAVLREGKSFYSISRDFLTNVSTN